MAGLTGVDLLQKKLKQKHKHKPKFIFLYSVLRYFLSSEQLLFRHFLHLLSPVYSAVVKIGLLLILLTNDDNLGKMPELVIRSSPQWRRL